MNCTQTQEWLDDLLLNSPAAGIPAPVADHIADCPSCRNDYEVALRTLASLRLSDIVEPSELLKARIAKGISEAHETGRAKTGKPHRVARLVFAFAAAVLVILSAAIVYLHKPAPNPQSILAFSLLEKAWAAEEVRLTEGGTLHTVNQIVVKSIPDTALAKARWVPLYAVDANGTMRFHQLKLGAEPGEEYVVDEQAWYDPATHRFLHVLASGGTPLFANAYDGRAVHLLEPASDGAPQAASAPVTPEFRVPESPAQCLGVTVGLPRKIEEMDKSMVSLGGEVRLEDGSLARVVTSGPPPGKGLPKGIEGNYVEFKIREQDDILVEMELFLKGQSALVIRRVKSERVDTPDISWDLTKLDTLVKSGGISSAPPSSPW